MNRRSLALAITLLAVLVLAISPGASQANKQRALSISGDGFFCCTHANAHIFTVTNEGGRVSGRLSVALTLDPTTLGDALAITNDGCRGKSLAPGATCDIEITWLVGPDTLANLTVAGKRGSATVQLSGTAVP